MQWKVSTQPERALLSRRLSRVFINRRRYLQKCHIDQTITYFLISTFTVTLASWVRMAETDATTRRAAGLKKLFHAVIHGTRDLKSAADGDRFLEALCAQDDVSKCVEVLVAAPAGLSATARAFRFSNSTTFINSHATSVLLRLSDPSLKQLYGGEFLQRIIEAIVNPASFWTALVNAHDARALTLDASHAFAWLLLELLISRSEDGPDVREIAEIVTDKESLINSQSLEVRNLGQKIKHILSTTNDTADGPGGRHDNDHANFRDIKILPTSDEFASAVTPYYRRAIDVEAADIEERGFIHIDNQFRLLREDMLGELRSDFQIAIGQKKGRRKTVFTKLQFAGIDCGSSQKRKPCLLQLKCLDDIPQLKHIKDESKRKTCINDSRNKNLMKHQSLGCLISGGKTIAFATVERDEDMLAKKPPIIVLRIAEEKSFRQTLLACKSGADLSFVQVDTAVFAYEPVLKCLQKLTDLPLQDQVLNLGADMGEVFSGIEPSKIVRTISDNWQSNLQHIIETDRPIQLDVAQTESLLQGLTKKVSLIQGPPGTGKSFIGALIARILKDHTKETMLVLTYTNHALDQFLEDLRNIGIPDDCMLRLGSKASPSTKCLSMFEKKSSYKMSSQTWNVLDSQKKEAESYVGALEKKATRFNALHIGNQALLDHLEFSDDSEFYDAFVAPDSTDGMIPVGKDGKAISRFYLIEQWTHNRDAGIFKAVAEEDFPHIWSMKPEARQEYQARWRQAILDEQVAEIGTLFKKYNRCQDQIRQLFKEKQSYNMTQARIIGCTTTAAAMYTEELRKAAPGIILVEEAGEILESHILTAMTAQTKQLVLIGDHKQLRPKVNNYSLTVEKGEGYNLNMSLFERLVHAGVPHVTLTKQHRMRPEIASLVKELTYPELENADKTENRPALRGFQDNVIFVSHNHPEVNADKIADRRDEDVKSSKENAYEADMVLRCIRYLGQQGYNTEDIVVLTPYLGQLYLLTKTLAAENDPYLNDLDSYELIRAGLLSPAGANISKRRIRISTIDNYQGEESDIVIVCLTRSNSVGDIGFMSAPQRVNVMLSRARNGLVMIGNPDTFINSRKGRDVWVPLMHKLKTDGHVYDGFPVKCEQHPDKTALLTQKDQFDTVCPDGGCSEPCGKLLACGLHSCPYRCHQLQDHSKMHCMAIVKSTCPNDHKFSRKCYNKAANACQKCEAATRAKEERARRDHKLEEDRQARQRAYLTRLVEIEDEIAHEKRLQQNRHEETEQEAALAQKRKDLENFKNHASKPTGSTMPGAYPSSTQANAPSNNGQNAPTTNQGAGTTSVPAPQQSPGQTPPGNSGQKSNTTNGGGPSLPWNHSDARDDWNHQKKFDGAENTALDSLMPMIGLETVKEKFLAIKNKVDTLVRQGVPLSGERLSAALLGNPGTGKTTVARLYADFLGQVGALPGSHFIETSGSALANDGVSKCRDQINSILQAGGGVFFIDEAYQLVSGNSPGGKAVLDYLLAEIENLTGKVVFVLAGYHKQMEAFFAHNPGIPSRIPIQMEFHDYTDPELQAIFCHYVSKKYHGRMKVEDDFSGLYVRIVARRIGRGRGREGFGNAREVQNKIAQIAERQAKRLRKQRRARIPTDDHYLTKEDLIGPEPAVALQNNVAWSKLHKLIGLQSVKETVQSLLDGIQTNYLRELDEKPLVEYSLNKCFIGSPGTGKTSVAKLYGKVLADLSLLSNGEVVVKNPADFIGNVIGGSEANTKAILASTVGKVLIIDEAYMLAGNSGDSSKTADSFKTAVIDTIVAEVQSTIGEDRCVLLLGYKDLMENMFRDVNPGLARRFPMESAFVFEDFDDADLLRILDLKLNDIGFNATDQAKRVAMEVLRRARNRPNFGNAGEVDIVLDRAKGLHQKHLSAGKVFDRDTLEAVDFDPDFDRGQRAATNLPALFKDIIGCDDVVKQLQGYQATAANMKARGKDPRELVPFSFLFKGPPGTGKTTTAQKMGKVFYDMGFLSAAKVVQCSATDLIGQYVGHTGPKVQKKLESAMGKVLFIDEAYRLAEGHFAVEAMDELVDCMTNPKYAKKMIIILAGYDKDIDRLLSMNPGLSSRFPETVFFKHMEPVDCLELLTKDLQRRSDTPLDLSVLSPPTPELKTQILDLFTSFSKLESWGNGRDVKALGDAMFRSLISAPVDATTSLVLTKELVLKTMQDTFQDRHQRDQAVGTSRLPDRSSRRNKQPPQQAPPQQPPPPPNVSSGTAKDPGAQSPPPAAPAKQAEQSDQSKAKPNGDPLDYIFQIKRDAGVSDAVWEELERDKHAFVAREREYKARQEDKKKEEQRIKDLIRAEKAAADEEERRQAEQKRIEAELERRRKDAELAVIEEQRARERKAQRRLKELGRCPAGYMWHKQSVGYRCAGGSHFLSDAQLGL
ncbi:P-loop containing nucleoside triphosphate hydrolase protein [Boeremia exigua]|uniref:P-loop containing nucleoside triphosphate hydrolase protein n=1 Tax=Boeremia exigua TaxID=749465 RepID=UPI001E8E5EBA|nr:P-loop containing nucleoside triphosphate hydrolase protein [Boeremia exigua]KAH6625605.1 P-loop containing nucleoside triphosphate hydrolase protein [Boeremia exigua]